MANQPDLRRATRREVRNLYDCPYCGAKKRFMCFLMPDKRRRQEPNHQERENEWYDEHQGGVGRHKSPER